MSIAFILNPGYNTINNVHHTFWDVDEDNIKNSSLNQALEVSTSVSAPVHNVGATSLSIGPVTGGLVSTAPQFEVPIVITNQVNTDSLLETTLDAGITVYNDLHLDSKNIDGVDELTCGTLHYTTLDPAIAGDASAWSTFPATQDVDLAGNYLVNNSGQDIKLAQPIQSVGIEGGGPNKSVFSSFGTTSDAGITFATSNDDLPNATGGGLSVRGKDFPKEFSFTTDPSATILDAASGDLVLISKPSSKIRLTYGVTASDKAISIASSGAIAFDTEYNDTDPIIEGSYGTAGQILSSQGDSAPPQWVNAPAPGDPSTWSDYPAIAAIETANFAIKNSIGTSVDITTPRINFTSPSKTELVIKSNTDTGTRPATIQLQSGTGFTDFASSFIIQNQPEGPGGLGYKEKPFAMAITSYDQGDIVLTAGITFPSSIHFAYDTNKAFTINPAGALAFDSLYQGVEQNVGNFGTSGQIIASQGDALPPHWIDIPPTTSSQYVYYVSKDGTVDAAGDVNHPLSTIQAAITLGQAAYPRQVVILIAPGVYTETLSITLPNITLLGYAPSANQNLLTQIVGNISIACTASQDLYYSQIGIFNLQVSGSITDTSSAVHSLNIEQCRLASTGRIVWQNSSVDNRTRLERVVLLHAAAGAGTDPLLCFSSGMATLNLLDITSKDNAPLLQFDGTATLNTCTLCNFSSTTTSATAAPIVYIAIANGGTAPLSQKGFAFAYCAFTYSSPVARAFSSGKNCGIVTDSITGNINLIITYNAFNLLLCDATCFVVSDINKNTPSKASTVRFFSNLSTYLATGIDTLVGNKTTFAAVA